MSISHLNDTELDTLLAGEALPAERVEHANACVVCRRRRDAFLHVVELAAGEDPSAATRSRLRDGALGAWGAPVRRVWWRWVAAAAAVTVLGLLPLLWRAATPRPHVDTDTVLEEVDRILAEDPLAALASRDVLEEVVPSERGPEGSAS